MSWLLKQAEDILNRVDQQTNAVLHQDNPQVPLKENQVEFTSNTSSYIPPRPSEPLLRPSLPPARRPKKTDESDLINYLNSSTPINQSETKKSIRGNNKRRTSSSSSTATTDDPPLSSKDRPIVVNIPSTEEQSEKESITTLRNQHENELQTYQRQQIQYQQQIAESDALLRDLRSRESDALETLSTKDSQIALLRVRLTESDESLQVKTNQYDQLQNEYSRLVHDSSNISSDFFQSRLQQFEQTLTDNERLSNANQQFIEQLKHAEKQLNDEHLQIYEQQQQAKHAKELNQQLEQEMNEYKIKAQRILQTKDKLISKLKDLVQQRSSIPTIGDQHEMETLTPNDDSTLLDVSLVGNPSGLSSVSSNWASIQYEDLKNENELFKQELQARELTIYTLRNEVQEAEVLIQQTDEQYQEQVIQLNEQLKEKTSLLILAEQDYRKLKQELTSGSEDFHKQKLMYQGQLSEREREIERLHFQLTSKAINHVNNGELEKRLQTLTESLIHKQTIIENLQTDKSSLTMQLERLDKRLDDYETITANNSQKLSSILSPLTSIPIDDTEHYDHLRSRVPLLRETPYDVDLTKKVKRAANQLDQLGVRLTIFLRRYPAVRLAVLFYGVVLHLWTFILLFTYAPEVHSNGKTLK